MGTIKVVEPLYNIAATLPLSQITCVSDCELLISKHFCTLPWWRNHPRKLYFDGEHVGQKSDVSTWEGKLDAVGLNH